MILLAVFLFFFSPPWGLAWYPRARNSLSFLEDASSPELVGVGWGKKILCLYACVFSLFSHVRLFATPWTVACQSPLSMGFSSKNTGVGLTFPSPGDLPNPGIKPRSPALQTDSLPSRPPGKASVSIGPLKCISQLPIWPGLIWNPKSHVSSALSLRFKSNTSLKVKGPVCLALQQPLKVNPHKKLY